MEKAFLTVKEIDAIVTAIATSVELINAKVIKQNYKPHEFSPTIGEALHTLYNADTVRELTKICKRISG